MTLNWTPRSKVYAPHSLEAREAGIMYRATPVGFNIIDGPYLLDIITPYNAIQFPQHPTLEAAQNEAENYAEKHRKK